MTDGDGAATFEGDGNSMPSVAQDRFVRIARFATFISMAFLSCVFANLYSRMSRLLADYYDWDITPAAHWIRENPLPPLFTPVILLVLGVASLLIAPRRNWPTEVVNGLCLIFAIGWPLWVILCWQVSSIPTFHL